MEQPLDTAPAIKYNTQRKGWNTRATMYSNYKTEIDGVILVDENSAIRYIGGIASRSIIFSKHKSPFWTCFSIP